MAITMKQKAPQYYSRLRHYFPEQEMKHLGQLEALLQYQPVYDKLETSEYLVLYADFPEFLFIDYLLVNANQRGGGLGTQLIEQLQSQEKPIILEVEPSTPDEPDTIKRRRFYTRNGFRIVDGVKYEREDDYGDSYRMDIMCWSPSQQISDENVLHMMAAACDEVHNYQAEKFYGRIPAIPEDVLQLFSNGSDFRDCEALLDAKLAPSQQLEA